MSTSPSEPPAATDVAALYFDGRSARAHAVTLRLAGELLLAEALMTYGRIHLMQAHYDEGRRTLADGRRIRVLTHWPADGPEARFLRENATVVDSFVIEKVQPTQ